MKYFSTKDIIVIAMFGALGVIVGFLGNILHSASSIIPFIGPAILHTVPQAIVLFSCVCAIQKPGSAILQCLIASLISMPLMGAPLFILSYSAQGIALDIAQYLLKERLFNPFWIAVNGAAFAFIGVIMLFYAVLPLQGIYMPLFIVLLSLPVNMILGVFASLIGFKVGLRAERVVSG